MTKSRITGSIATIPAQQKGLGVPQDKRKTLLVPGQLPPLNVHSKKSVSAKFILIPLLAGSLMLLGESALAAKTPSPRTPPPVPALILGGTRTANLDSKIDSSDPAVQFFNKYNSLELNGAKTTRLGNRIAQEITDNDGRRIVRVQENGRTVSVGVITGSNFVITTLENSNSNTVVVQCSPIGQEAAPKTASASDFSLQVLGAVEGIRGI